MPVTDSEIAAIVGVTGAFEVAGDPYEGVSGDFDGQGISCGVLQWNIGQGSLQPLVVAVGRSGIVATMPGFGARLWSACNSPLAQGLAEVRSWQTNRRLHAQPRAELKALMGSAAMRAEQDRRIRATAGRAAQDADAWAAARGGNGRSRRELAFFFDMRTQNGSPGGLTFADVVAFRHAAGPGRADDLICDWLVSRPANMAGAGDGVKNASVWRNTADEHGLDLLVLGYLRSQKAKLQWRVDVLNRKGTIALRGGHVHGKSVDLRRVLSD